MQKDPRSNSAGQSAKVDHQLQVHCILIRMTTKRERQSSGSELIDASWPSCGHHMTTFSPLSLSMRKRSWSEGKEQEPHKRFLRPCAGDDAALPIQVGGLRTRRVPGVL
ncbi:hypothetical protein MN608_01552 [Microdochium nivale]|nr:hypothetical protein MN608_01552 [Microdochium nivale]